MPQESKEWSEALRDAWVSGSLASALSTIALAVNGRVENDSAAGPINGPSQWAWGEHAAYVRQVTWRHTFVGYVIHHLSSVFWATWYEKYLNRDPSRTRARILVDGALIAALACLVDYQLTPRRFKPGFEKQLSRQSLFTVYASFGLGLAAVTLWQRQRSLRTNASELSKQREHSRAKSAKY